jgi:hypothetical protein
MDLYGGCLLGNARVRRGLSASFYDGRIGDGRVEDGRIDVVWMSYRYWIDVAIDRGRQCGQYSSVDP